MRISDWSSDVCSSDLPITWPPRLLCRNAAVAGQRPIPMSAASLSAMGESQAGAGPSREDAPTPKPWLSCRRENWHAGPLPMSHWHLGSMIPPVDPQEAIFSSKRAWAREGDGKDGGGGKGGRGR